uniref:BTB domain-containing protein n=1 Tax=Gouania willdenowi TaxID=441366 RepID=A0A8C5GKX4_GOUWI
PSRTKTQMERARQAKGSIRRSFSSASFCRLFLHFLRLRSMGKMCDVVLEVGDVSFPCHRALLASSSDYFWALFGESTAESRASTICLLALTPQGLEAILDFLYSGWLSLSHSTIPDVLEAARYLQVDPAVSICQQFMTDGLNTENCCSYANLAERHGLSDAFEAANQTIARVMRNLLRESRDDLLNLNIQSLLAVFDTDEIPGVKEVELIKLALDWLEANGPLPLLKSNLLLSHLRFGLVTTSDLTTLSKSHCAMTSPLIRSQVTRALEYHRLGSEMENENEEPKKSVSVATSNQVWRYDPRFDCWEQGESMLESRAQFTCCVVEDLIYIVGGQNTNPITAERTSVASVEFYDIATGKWRKGPTMPRPLYGHAATVLDNSVYVSGGVSDNVLNIGSNNYEDLGLKGRVWEKRASMSIARFSHRLAAAHGYIYSLLGKYEPFCDIERYDSESDHWTRLKPLFTGSFNYGMVPTASGNLLLFGGTRWNDGQQVNVKSVLEYDTKKDCWKEIGQLPRPLTGIECTLLPLPD